ncbi:unnamed protein product, partial [marine sediment metagenome]
MNSLSKENDLKDKTPRLNYVACDFCNSKQFNIVLKSKDYFFKQFNNEFQIVKCQICGLIYTNPRLIKRTLRRYYADILCYNPQPSSSNLKIKSDLPISKEILSDYFNYPLLEIKRLRKIIQFPNYLRIYKKWKRREIILNYIKNGKILEVGCSYGGYLLILKRLGWIVKGL